MGPSRYSHQYRQTTRNPAIVAQLTRLLARLAFGSMAVVLLLGLTAPANAQGAVRSVHGDWQIRCDTPPGAKAEQCA